MKRSAFSVSGTLAALALATASAAVTAQAPATAPPTSAAMNFQQVVERIAAQGYSDVREIERKSDKLYEIKARNAQGQRVELHVDARSGEVLREEVKR